METLGHCLRCNKNFTGEFCPRCDTDRLPPRRRPGSPSPGEQIVRDLYAEGERGGRPGPPR